MDIKQIKPLVGLGQLRFGMTRDEVRSILGDPEDIDEYSFTGEDGDRSESWHYDEIDLSMSFDAEDDWRMITLAVSSPEYELERNSMVGEDQEHIRNKLIHMGFQELREENESTLNMPGHHLLAAHHEFMNFWFEEGKLKEIQWSPRFNDDDEVEWPKE